MPPSPLNHQAVATSEDIRRLERQIADLSAALERQAHDLNVQFTRMAQLQADVDVIRGGCAQGGARRNG